MGGKRLSALFYGLLFSGGVGLFFLFPGVCWTEDANDPVPEVQGLLANHEPEKAYDLLWQALLDDPADARLNFLFGRAALDLGRYETAAAAYERVLMVKPDQVWARFQLGWTYFQMGSYALAKAEFDRILASHPEEPILGGCNRYLAEIEKRTSQHRLDIAVSAGTVYDTNVNAGPLDSTITTSLGPPVTLGPGSTKESDWGTVLGLRGLYRWDPGEEKGFQWIGRVGKRNIFYAQAHAADLSVTSLSTGPAYEQDALNLELPVTANFISFGSDDYARYYGVNPSVNWAFTPDLAISGQATVQSRDYVTNDPKDGSYMALELMPGFSWAQKRYRVQFRLGYAWENTEAGFEENDGFSSAIVFYATLHERLKGIVQLDYQLADYDRPDPTYGETRQDDRYRSTISLLSPLPWWNLDLGVSYVYTRNRSNLDVFDYRREQTTCLLTKRF